jgi:ubiquinone/menaquinone biosynthesis C-methylase UbiE
MLTYEPSYVKDGIYQTGKNFLNLVLSPGKEAPWLWKKTVRDERAGWQGRERPRLRTMHKNSRNYKRFDPEGAKEFAGIANEIFAPIYPLIAGQIMKRCNVREGICIDVGTGASNLAVALADASDLRIYAMDFSWNIQRMAMENIVSKGLQERIRFILGDVHRMPFHDNLASLVVSRGSMRFWKNKPRAFKELHRILKPGGKGYVGGGAGSAALSRWIDEEMNRRGFEWKHRAKLKYTTKDHKYFHETMHKAGIEHYGIIHDDSGFWIYFEK